MHSKADIKASLIYHQQHASIEQETSSIYKNQDGYIYGLTYSRS